MGGRDAPFFMAIKIDGTAVTGERAGWPGNQTLDPWDAAQGGAKYVLAADMKTAPGPKSLTNSTPPGYSTAGMPDGSTGFGGSGASGPLGQPTTLTEGDVLGIVIPGGASADSTKTAVATATINGSGTSMTVDLTVKNGTGVTEAKVKAVGTGYVMNERVKVAKAGAGTTADVELYIL